MIPKTIRTIKAASPTKNSGSITMIRTANTPERICKMSAAIAQRFHPRIPRKN